MEVTEIADQLSSPSRHRVRNVLFRYSFRIAFADDSSLFPSS